MKCSQSHLRMEADGEEARNPRSLRRDLLGEYRQKKTESMMAEKMEDLNLPNAVVTRIIKEALPSGVTVGKEARAAVTKAAFIFILYLTSSANSVAKKANRKTISSADVIQAMEDIDFDQFIEPLQEALENFKKTQKEKKDATTKRKQQKKDEDDGVDGTEDE
ncbi:DNA polymerase epsilon subunit 3 [Orussus abietinus]|uniref:DNA polymerase epsilon subunit 3 n=1 Tax=Orussus abietinus TaxID=222816 RepID=UPI000626904C|nr:DNA polymerase epsilon subunit 3 [Orussus abietinus]